MPELATTLQLSESDKTAMIEAIGAQIEARIKTGVVSPLQTQIANEWVNEVKEGFIAEHGYDPDEVWNNQDRVGFSLKKVRENIHKHTLREAVTETQFSALTRYGVVKQIIGGYNLAPTAYEGVALIVNSNTFEENYAPTYGTDIPDVVEDGEEAGESRLAGFQIRIGNQRYAKVFAISKTLFEDDQTGQIKLETGQFGKRMKHAEEKAAMVNFFAQGQTSNIGTNGGQVPSTNIAGYALGQGNAVTTAGQISQANIENAVTAMSYVTDPLGNLLLPNWNALLCAATDKLLVKKILQSMYSSAVPSATAGTVGYFMTDNVLKGEFDLFSTPFISTTQGVRAGISTGAPWALLEKQSKALIFQNRTSLKIVQETPTAGKSFDRNEFRYLNERRFGTNPVDSRYAFYGN